MNKPVYVFSGFLDSGKTTIIKDTLNDRRFNEGEKTILIVFENGDVEYDETFAKNTNTEIIYLDSLKDFDLTKMQELDQQYQPERIMLELNGMDDDNVLYKTGFIKGWELAQALTTIDASTFRLYSTNMRQFMYNHIVKAEVVIINRCKEEDMAYLRNNIKGINQRVDIIFEDEEGRPIKFRNEDIFTGNEITVFDDDYGLWYMDALDNPFKYEGKKIELNARYIEDVSEYENVAIMGRTCMTCCINDMQDISFTAVGVDKSQMHIEGFYHLKAHIKCLKDEDGYDTCVLYVDELTDTGRDDRDFVTFS